MLVKDMIRKLSEFDESMTVVIECEVMAHGPHDVVAVDRVLNLHEVMIS